MLGLGRRRLPAAVTLVRLPAGERRISWAVTSEGAAVVASTRALHLPGGEALGWDAIERVRWETPVLKLIELTEVEGSGRRHTLHLDLDAATDLPETVRARVTASVAWSAHVKLRPAGGVRIVGRRRAGQEVLDWQLVFDRGTDPGDPALRAQADEHVAAARRAIG